MSFFGTAIGRLTQEPVLKTTPNNKPVVEFRIACDSNGGRGTSYFNVETWMNTDSHMKHLTKGSQVALPGAEIIHNQWEDGEGNRRERYVIKANQVQYLKTKPAQTADTSGTADTDTAAETTES